MIPDPHAAPPSHLRVFFKQWQKSSPGEVDSNLDILDTAHLTTDARAKKVNIDHEHQESITKSFDIFVSEVSDAQPRTDIACYEVKALPGGHSTMIGRCSIHNF